MGISVSVQNVIKSVCNCSMCSQLLGGGTTVHYIQKWVLDVVMWTAS